MKRIYHFISQSDLTMYLSDGSLRLPSLVSEGFIHCSRKEQVLDVANGLMPGRDDLMLLEIDEEKVIPKIIYENLEGSTRLFPHIYGPLNEDAIIAVHPFLWDAHSGFVFPWK